MAGYKATEDESVRKLFTATVLLVLASSFVLRAHLKPATPEEEMRMMGKVAGAIEDVGGGYTKEGLSRFTWINKELKRREYSLWTRWTAHRWNAQALFDSGKPQAALEIVLKAEEEANALPNETQRKTAKEETAKLKAEVQAGLSKK